MVKTSKVKNGACFFQGVGNMLKNFCSHHIHQNVMPYAWSRYLDDKKEKL